MPQPNFHDTSYSDAHLHSLIVQAIALDSEIDDVEIEVLVYERGVMLNGTVPTGAMRLAAERCARSVSGVKGVTNNLSSLVDGAGRLSTTPPFSAGVTGLV